MNFEESKGGRSTQAEGSSASATQQRHDSHIFVDVDEAPNTEDYSDEEEAQFHAQYKDKNFV